jgi:hypothetical protein
MDHRPFSFASRFAARAVIANQFESKNRSADSEIQSFPLSMGATINIRGLKRFETGEDGTSIVLFAEDSGGQLVALHLPLDCISALIMTLPRMVNAVVRQRANDQSLRLAIR